MFGYDRERNDDTGKVVKRVIFPVRFLNRATWRSRLVSSDSVATVEAVQWGLESIRDCEAVGHVLWGLNAQDLKTPFGNSLRIYTVIQMLGNP